MAEARRRRWLVFGAQFLGLLVAIAIAQFVIGWVRAGDPAPALGGRMLDGSSVALSGEAPPGRVVLVHFWASWCPICRLELDSIDALARDYEVISVAMQSGDAAEVGAYLREQGAAFPVLLDESGALGERWGVRGVPMSFVIDADGRMRFVERGYVTGAGLRLRMWLAEQVSG
ncbi:MAG: protein disulfide oxidoreductase [Chromatiales bacterium]|nr:protein disulfide oxidoreductase [Chromatiales bacterium]